MASAGIPFKSSGFPVAQEETLRPDGKYKVPFRCFAASLIQDDDEDDALKIVHDLGTK